MIVQLCLGINEHIFWEAGQDHEVELDWFDRDEEDIVAEVGKMIIDNCKDEPQPILEFSSSVFPNDFWFLLSEYILPEEVGRFACISHVTRHIVSSQSFWRRMYSRYYSSGQFGVNSPSFSILYLFFSRADLCV